jgi:hypothetical protein
MTWVDSTHLLVAGNLFVNGSQTLVTLYDAQNKFFSYVASMAGAPLGGQIAGLTPGNTNGSASWIGGATPNGAAFLSKYDGATWTNVTGQLGNGTVIKGLQIFTLTTPHDNTPLLDNSNALLVLGHIVFPNMTASAALFNGTTFTPFLLTSTSTSIPGSAVSVTASNPLNFFSSGGHHLAVGFIVLIGLALSLAVIFLLIAAGLLIRFLRRKRAGYVRAPTEKGAATAEGGPAMLGSGDIARENIRRIPPGQLFGSLGGAQTGRGWSSAVR